MINGHDNTALSRIAITDIISLPMKYLVILPDGAADFPLDELEGKTAFEAARIPNIDSISITGRQGIVHTTPPGYSAGSDICSMSLLGYDPQKYHPGRAPLEAAAMGLKVNPGEWVFRCNLVSIVEERMADHSAGHISSAEGRKLLQDYAALLHERGLAEGLEFHPGISYRNLMVDRSGRTYENLQTTAPHDVPGEQAKKHLPRGGKESARIRELIALSQELFAHHEVNLTRLEMNEALASSIWLWGQGTPRPIPAFQEKYGLRGAMITAVDLLAGIAALIGWHRLQVPGITGYHDTDYAAKGHHAAEALDHFDLVCVHIEAPDEASHQADSATKVASLESIDELIVGPVLEKLRSYPQWRVLLLPDHYTRCATRKHDSTPPPFCMAGTGVNQLLSRPFSEAHAQASGLQIRQGHELMEYFLKSGL